MISRVQADVRGSAFANPERQNRSLTVAARWSVRAGIGGVRLEDNALVTEAGGPMNLTKDIPLSIRSRPLSTEGRGRKTRHAEGHPVRSGLMTASA